MVNSKRILRFFIPLLACCMVNLVSSFFHDGWDLTSEKRFTLSGSTRNLIASVDQPMELTVYLDGDIPAGFRRLARSAEELGAAFHDLSDGKFTVRFEKPGLGLDDSSKALLFDSLQRMGIHPTNVKAQVRQGEQTEETLVFPGAILTGSSGQTAIDFLEGQSNINGLASLNNAEALMEFKLAKAVLTLTRDTVPVIAYLTGNGQPLDLRIYDLVEQVLKKEYRFRILPIDSVPYIPLDFSALMVVKPTAPFRQDQKLKIDQYIMNGGKVFWAIDNLYASMDSLQRSSGSFIAFDMGLDLDDQLFTYGARVNRDLVQDLESDKIPSVIGSVGDKPQIELLPWPYAPLLRSYTGHPISKDLDVVLSSFPQSLDTISTLGITKTVLLSTSEYARSLQTPALVEWRSIRNEEDLKNFNRSRIPVAMLLEGTFHSAFKNRVPAEEIQKMKEKHGMPFRTETLNPNRMIIAADGDLVLNAVSEREGPMAMGENPYTRERFANRELISNSLFYLTGGASVMDARAKTYTLRLLDKGRIETEKTFWQLLNLFFPAFLCLLVLPVYHFLRKRKFASQVRIQAAAE